MLNKIILKHSCKPRMTWETLRHFNILTWPKTGFTSSSIDNWNATIIDGKELASKIKRLLIKEIEYLQQNHTPIHCKEPKLGYIIVGDRADSHLYVKMK